MGAHLTPEHCPQHKRQCELALESRETNSRHIPTTYSRQPNFPVALDNLKTRIGQRVTDFRRRDKKIQRSGAAPRTTEVSNADEWLNRTADKVTLGLKKILVPVDFSECSNKALEYAAALSRQFGAQLMLLHVVEPYPPILQMDPVDLVVLQDARRKLEACRSRLPATIGSKAALRIGEVDREIIKAAEDSGADLIILTTHRRSKLRHVLGRGTMEKAARRAACPILVVREVEHDFIEPFQSSEDAGANQPSPEAVSKHCRRKLGLPNSALNAVIRVYSRGFAVNN